MACSPRRGRLGACVSGAQKPVPGGQLEMQGQRLRGLLLKSRAAPPFVARTAPTPT